MVPCWNEDRRESLKVGIFFALVRSLRCGECRDKKQKTRYKQKREQDISILEAILGGEDVQKRLCREKFVKFQVFILMRRNEARIRVH